MKLPSEFDLHAIEVFVMTVRLGGMSACAQNLGITQSAVSQTVARIEAALGTPLFDRSARPMRLTVAGKALFDRGAPLIAQARATYDAIRAEAGQPIASVTVAMSISLANQLTAPLVNALGSAASRWDVRSGISLEHHGAFLARDIDMLVTGSFALEHRDTVELHPVFSESFVLVFPGDYAGSTDLAPAPSLPFVRFTRLSGMGQQIERQLVRLKLILPHSAEVDSAHQQLALVASGYGWTVTSPVCLAAQPELFGQLKVAPMPRGRFARNVQVVARSGELGDLPKRAAELSAAALRDGTFPPLVARFPWLADQLEFPQ